MTGIKMDRFQSQHQIRDSNRKRILSLLFESKDTGLAFKEIITKSGLSPPQVTKHLKFLKDNRMVDTNSGFIEAVRKGSKKSYKIKTARYIINPKGEEWIKTIWPIQSELDRLSQIHDDKFSRYRVHNFIWPKEQSKGFLGVSQHSFMKYSKNTDYKTLSIYMDLLGDALSSVPLKLFDNIIDSICELKKQKQMQRKIRHKLECCDLPLILNEYLPDDELEIIVLHHIKIKEFKEHMINIISNSKVNKKRIGEKPSETIHEEVSQ